MTANMQDDSTRARKSENFAGAESISTSRQNDEKNFLFYQIRTAILLYIYTVTWPKAEQIGGALERVTR